MLLITSYDPIYCAYPRTSPFKSLYVQVYKIKFIFDIFHAIKNLDIVRSAAKSAISTKGPSTVEKTKSIILTNSYHSIKIYNRSITYS